MTLLSLLGVALPPPLPVDPGSKSLIHFTHATSGLQVHFQKPDLGQGVVMAEFASGLPHEVGRGGGEQASKQ